MTYLNPPQNRTYVRYKHNHFFPRLFQLTAANFSGKVAQKILMM